MNFKVLTGFCFGFVVGVLTAYDFHYRMFHKEQEVMERNVSRLQGTLSNIAVTNVTVGIIVPKELMPKYTEWRMYQKNVLLDGWARNWAKPTEVIDLDNFSVSLPEDQYAEFEAWLATQGVASSKKPTKPSSDR